MARRRKKDEKPKPLWRLILSILLAVILPA